MLVVARGAPHETEIRQRPCDGHRRECIIGRLSGRMDALAAHRVRQFLVELHGIKIGSGKGAPGAPAGLHMLENGGQVPDRGSRAGRIAQRRRLPADGQHMARRGVGAESEVVVAVGELLREPTVERHDRVVVALQCRGGIVAHLVMYPCIPVVLRIGQRGRPEQISAVLNIRPPGSQGGKVEVGSLVFLHEDYNAYHDENSPRVGLTDWILYTAAVTLVSRWVASARCFATSRLTRPILTRSRVDPLT